MENKLKVTVSISFAILAIIGAAMHLPWGYPVVFAIVAVLALD